jgi:hypothetical protein
MAFEPPLELFSLERKGRLVAGRPFRLLLSLRSNPLESFAPAIILLHLKHAAAAREPAEPRMSLLEMSLRSKPLESSAQAVILPHLRHAAAARKSAEPRMFLLEMSLRSKPLKSFASAFILLHLMHAARRASRPSRGLDAFEQIADIARHRRHRPMG